MRFKISFLCVAMAAIMDWLPAQATININVEAVQKSVVFLYAADAQGAVDKNRPIGTGFLVGIPLKSDPKHRMPFLSRRGIWLIPLGRSVALPILASSTFA
jgi:hypothetical protein